MRMHAAPGQSRMRPRCPVGSAATGQPGAIIRDGWFRYVQRSGWFPYGQRGALSLRRLHTESSAASADGGVTHSVVHTPRPREPMHSHHIRPEAVRFTYWKCVAYPHVKGTPFQWRIPRMWPKQGVVQGMPQSAVRAAKCDTSASGDAFRAIKVIYEEAIVSS